MVAAVMACAGMAAYPGSAGATALQPWSEGVRASIVLEALSGERIDLATLGGRVVLVHFFATWCEPCRAEMASLQRLAVRHKDRPLTILAVNVAEVGARVRRFFEDQPVSFPVLLDADRAVTRSWRVEMLPTTFVLDMQSRPALVATGDVDWDRADIDATITGLMPALPDKK